MEIAKRKHALRLPARAGIWNIISAVVARGVGMVGTPIFTRILSPAEYGVYPLYTTWLGLFTSLATVGLAGGAIYRAYQRYGKEKNRLLSAALGLFFAIFGIFMLLTFLAAPLITSVSGLDSGILYMMLGDIFLSSVVGFCAARAKYEYKYKQLAAINIASALLLPGIALLFTYTPYRAEARIFASVIVSLIVALPQLALAFKRAPRLYDGEIWRYLLSVGLPLLPHLVSSSLILRVGEMVIGRAYGTAAVGKYSVAISVGFALTVLTNGLLQVVSPWVLRKIGANDFPAVQKMLGISVRALLLATLFVLAFAPEIMRIITPPEYHDALFAVYPLALSGVAVFISNSAVAAEMYYEKNGRASLVSIAVALLSLLLAVLLLPRLDYRAASIFTFSAYVLSAYLNIRTFKRLSGEKLLHGWGCAADFALATLYAFLLFLFRGIFLSRLLLAAALLPIIFSVGRRVLEEIKEK